MVESLLLNRKCWLQHIALNQTTGLDPDGIKVYSSFFQLREIKN